MKYLIYAIRDICVLLKRSNQPPKRPKHSASRHQRAHTGRERRHDPRLTDLLCGPHQNIMLNMLRLTQEVEHAGRDALVADIRMTVYVPCHSRLPLITSANSVSTKPGDIDDILIGLCFARSLRNASASARTPCFSRIHAAARWHTMTRHGRDVNDVTDPRTCSISFTASRVQTDNAITFSSNICRQASVAPSRRLAS